MRNRISIVMLGFALTVFSLFGCQSREVPASTFPDPSELAQANENSEPSPENAPVENPEPAPPVEEPPAESTIPAALDYYFIGSLYGMGDYPDFSTLLDDPGALSRLKQFYTDLNLMVDRVEYHTQSLSYDGTYTGDVKFSRNGSLNQAGDDNNTHTSLKTLMVGKLEYDAFDDVLESGRGFDEDDFTVSAVTDSIPVLLGHDYHGVYQLGDELTFSLHTQPLHFTVIGFLQSNTTFQFDQEIPLDQHIIAPFYDIAYEPTDAVNQYYQTIYYTQKCDGFVQIDASADAEQMFREVGELAQKNDLLYAVTPTRCRVSEKLAETHSA